MGAVRKRDLSYFSFFLHHFEKRLNGVIYRFLTRNGYDRYDPARFMDYKLEVLQMLLYCLPKFDPEQKTEFLKYAKPVPLPVLQSTGVYARSAQSITIRVRDARR